MRASNTNIAKSPADTRVVCPLQSPYLFNLYSGAQTLATMLGSTLSLKQASTVLLILSSFTAKTIGNNIDARGNVCQGSCCDDDVTDDEIAGNENAFDDGPTSDQSPGLGVEFETGDLLFNSVA